MLPEYWNRSQSSFAAQLAHPLQDRLPPLANSRVANPRIFLKYASVSHGLHAHALGVFFKLQLVSRTNSQSPPDFPRDRHLPFARHLRLFLHRRFPNSLLYHNPPYFSQTSVGHRAPTPPDDSFVSSVASVPLWQ